MFVMHAAACLELFRSPASTWLGSPVHNVIVSSSKFKSLLHVTHGPEMLSELSSCCVHVVWMWPIA